MPTYSKNDRPPWENMKSKILSVSVSGLTSVGSYAFYDYTLITSLSLSSSVTNVNTYAFYNCLALKKQSYDCFFKYSLVVKLVCS
jgi:hypothetical protein